MVYCLICGCSDSEASKMHHFPTNSEKCKLWHDNLGIKYNNRNMKNYYLCSNHFDEHCYVDKVTWKLKRNALPMKYMNAAASSEMNVNTESHMENCQPLVAGPSRDIHIDFPTEIEKSCDITKKINKSVFRGIPGVSRKLSTPRKLKMMKLIESKESHIRSLKKLAKSRADNMRQLCSLGESSVVKELFKDMPSVTADFLITQLKCSNKSPKGRRWTINEKVLALALFKRGPKCYNLLRKIVAMPSKKTLTDLLGQVPFESGINIHILQHINNSIKSDEDRVCALLLDEMDIKEHIQYDSQRDRIRGYEEAGSQSSALANKALVFMVKGIQSSWKQPVAYYFTNNAMSGSVLSKLIIEVIEACQNVAHLDIVATINDCGTNNVKALKQLGSSVQTPFIQCGGKKIFTIYDPPHLLKCTVSLFRKHNVNLPVPSLNNSIMEARFGDIRRAHEIDSTSPLIFRAMHKIKSNHLEPKMQYAMKVSIAGQLMSRTVSSFLYTLLSRDHIREFTCGMNYYRTFHIDSKGETLYVGAMDRVYRLNLSNINQSNCERDALNLEPTNVASCVSKGKSEHFDCRNHIRVIQSMGDGSRLYVCGTNAHNPKDWVINSNLTHLPRNTFVPGIGMGIAKCPYDPADNSTAVWVERGNPGDLAGLYSGTNAEFTKADTVIFRTDLHNLTTGRKEYSFKRTLKYDSKWLDKPNFVGSFDIGEYVLFFFRETAVEYINCGKNVYSRVARVCKRDTGGKNILSQNWATYLKARLNCSIPGEFPFYFNEIQSVYKVPGDDNRFYGTFTTSTNGLMGSAICSFTLPDIQVAFSGKFKEQATSSSAWLPVLSSKVPEPRPGTCVNDTETLPDTVLNFIRSHPLMDSAIMHENEKPVYFKRDIFFTKLVVDKIKVDIGGAVLDYTVYYAGTNDGRVHKIVEWIREGEASSILLDVFDVTPGEPIQIMELSKLHKALYAASDYRVKQVDLVMCNRRYDNCLRCVHDPYCGWDKDLNVCKPYSPGLLQDVSNSTHDVCDSSVVKKKMVVTWGQSLHLGCFLKMPAVLSSQTITWYHYSKEKGRYKIQYRPDKYVETSEHGLVIIAVTESDAGRYDCWMGASLLCSFNVTVDAHRCSPPAKSNDYQKIYSDWCHEFEKYKSAMKTWEKKQAQCSTRQNTSNQNSHPNEIYRPLV